MRFFQRLPGFKKFFLLPLCSILISLILMELGIRIFAPQPVYYAPRYLFEADDILGYRLSPNFTGFYRTPENKVKIEINSRGLRDYEHGEKNGIRILGLGDSFVMGAGVELEESFLCLLEKHLNSNTEGKNFEVIKAGVQGYGTDQELAYLKTYGLEYEPALVILGFYPNDVVDNLLPNFTVRNGYLVMEDKKLKEKRGRAIDFNLIAGLVKNKIHLFRFITGRMRNNSAFRKIFLKSTDRLKKTRKKRIAVYERSPDKEIQKGWVLTKRLLLELKNTIQVNNSELLIVYIPERFQVYKEQWERVKKQWELNENDYDIRMPQSVLSDFCKVNKIPFLDLGEVLGDHVERGEEIYYTLDPHLTTKGNEVVATSIYEEIIGDNLIHGSSNNG